MEFTSLEQRMAQTYIDLFPEFIPDEEISISEQEQFYYLIKSLYKLAFDEPLLFVPSLHKDDAYPNRFNKSAYGKPELLSNMKKFLKAIDTLLQNMVLIGQNNEIKISKRQQDILLKLGINDFNKLPIAWKWITNRPNSNLIEFSHCMFNRNISYTSDIYAKLLGKSAFKKLENWMFSQGYKRYDINNVTASNCRLSLTYANPLWDNTLPNGGFEYKIKHTGISIRYDREVINPTVFGLCIPKGFLGLFLKDFDLMETKTKNFVIFRTKKCDGCRYCVQTDKSNKRSFAYTTINFENKNHNLCTYFPGYNYCWTSINDDLVDHLIDFLEFMDKYIPKKNEGK